MTVRAVLPDHARKSAARRPYMPHSVEDEAAQRAERLEREARDVIREFRLEGAVGRDLRQRVCRGHPRPRSSLSFNHFVSQLLKLQRHVQVQRLGGLEVDEKFEPGRLLHRQLAGFGALQDLIGIKG